MRFVLLAQVMATLSMVGVIWFAQVVHYPLLKEVGDKSFMKYQALNMQWTGWVVIPFMFVELLTAVILLWKRPEGVFLEQALVGIALLGVIWVSTFLLQVPRHRVLSQSFDRKVHRSLVRTNWIRTIAWSARGILVLWMVS